MGYRQLKYNEATQTLRLEFPDEWDVASVTAITLTILDRDATELLAADAMTLYTATTLDEDAAQYLDTAVLAAGSDAVVQGDMLHISGVAGNEVKRVRSYDSSTREVTFETILDYAHADGDAVRGMFATIVVDTSVVATFTAGLPVTLLWTPDVGQAFTEFAEVSKTSLQIQGLEERFAAIYKRAYDDFKQPSDKFSIMREEAERQVRSEMLSYGLDINRIVDTDGIIAPVIMTRMAYLWTLNGDVNKDDEHKKIGDEYNAQIGYLKALPIWTDTDQDLVEDEEEVSPHNTWYRTRGW